jgi:predicted Zn-dependent protease
MIGNKIPFILYQSLAMSLCSILFLPPLLLSAEPGNVSEISVNHEVILKNHKGQPLWMELWEKARSAVKNNNKQDAVLRYQKLFQEKPQIEEALREYVVVLMDLKQWQEAGKSCQTLLEIDPTSLEYLLYAGRVAQVQKRYQKAAKYLGQVYSRSPDGPFSIEALRGQIDALQKMGRNEMANPLMEQLYLLIPHEEGFIRQLASLSKELGHDIKARNYYKTLINEFGGTDVDFLESEPLFVSVQDMDMSLQCWLGYLKLHPFYIDYHKKLSLYYLENDLAHKALSHLLVRVAHGEENPQIFLQIGKIYLYEESRPDKALFYYEEYRKRNLNDKQVASEIKRIQAILANDLLVIVENEGAWNLWRDLAKVIPDRLAVYYSMAEQLEKLGKNNELLEVLQIIQIHNPEDQEVLFKLASLYFTLGNSTASTETLDSLKSEQQNGKEYLFLRAAIAEKTWDYAASLEFYKQYLLQNSDDFPLILKCLKRSGEVGLIKKLNFFYSLLPKYSHHKNIVKQGRFLYGEALVKNKLFSQARHFYDEFQERINLSDNEYELINRQYIQILLSEEKYFQAEQKLRLLLTEKNGRIERIHELIQTNLLQKDWHSAWKWYDFLVSEAQPLNQEKSQVSFDLFIEKASILEQSSQVEVATEMIEDYLEQILKTESADQLNQSHILHSKLAELYFKEKEFQKSKDILEPLILVSPGDMETEILLKITNKYLLNREDLSAIIDDGQQPVVTLSDRSRIYKRHGEYQTALALCKKYLVQFPDSLHAKVLKAELLQSTGDDFTPLTLFKTLSLEYPGEENFRQNVLLLQFKNAKFKELIEELAPAWKSVKGTDSTLSVRRDVPEIESLPVHQKLLLARAFWADKRQNDALTLYHSLLDPPVDHAFTEQLNFKKIELLLPPPKKTFLNTITFTNPAEPDRLDVVMSPEFTCENFEKPVAQIAASLYSDYRWQQMVSSELSVRKAMVDGNYYQAMKEYQNILTEESSPESLYDLAGVYSRLGFSGKEAALYEIIKKESPGYPDLDEAIQRNSLKRKTRVMPLFEFETKEGRDDYYDIRERTAGLQAMIYPSPQYEFQLDVQRIYDESLLLDENLWRNRINAGMQWSPVYDLDFIVSVGFDHTDDVEYKNTFLYDLQINGRMGDMVVGSLSLSQDVVGDTLESLRIGIHKKEYEAGIKIDLLPRLFGGGKYFFSEYSDGNHQNKYDLWSSYTLISEPTLLQFRYGYEIIHNAEGNTKRDFSVESGFASDDHPYWTPKEYWQHLFTVSFEHQLAENVLGRGAPSYYTLEYSFGYDSGGYDTHEAKAQIFLEMSRHFLLNSSVEVIDGSEVQETRLMGSLIYRW